jgi:hypothetical protein
LWSASDKTGNTALEDVPPLGSTYTFLGAVAENVAMNTQTATLGQRAAARWASAKPVALGLAIGLVAGPIVSGYAGFQVRTSVANAATRAGVIEQQAGFCAERARASSPATARSDWQGQMALARQWSVMPGSTAVDQDVVIACSRKLSS